MKNCNAKKIAAQKYSLAIFAFFVGWLSALLSPASGATISGTVTDSAGPVAGIIIGLGQFDLFGHSYPLITSQKTEPDGAFIFPSRHLGDYMLSVPSNWDETPYYRQVTIVSVAEDDDIHLDIQLELASTISGTIRRADGELLTAEELENIQIAVYPTLESACNYTFSNTSYISIIPYVRTVSADGSYSITGLSPGSYYVAARGNGTVNYIPEWSEGSTSVSQCNLSGSVEVLSPGSQINGINFQLDPGSTIQGQVYHISQTPADGLRVGLIINNTDTDEDACDLTLHPALSVDVGEDGIYVVTGLPPGDYSLFASSKVNDPNVNQEWLTGINTDSSPDCLLTEKLTVTSEEPEQVFEQRNFQIGTGGNISGAVFQPGGQTPVDDVYVVRFHDSCATEGDEAEAMTASGKYTSPVLPAGDYSLALLNEDKSKLIGWRTASGISADSCADSDPLHVEEDVTTSGIDFILKPEVNLIPIYFLLLEK